MERRKFLIGAAGTAIGGSALVGSGAFTSVEADRDVNVEVAGDASAFLALDADEGVNSAYAEENGGTVQVNLNDNADFGDITETNGGEGVNENAVSVFQELFEVRNQGTQDVAVWVDAGDGVSPDEVTAGGLPDEDRDFAQNGAYIDPQAANAPLASDPYSLTGVYGSTMPPEIVDQSAAMDFDSGLAGDGNLPGSTIDERTLGPGGSLDFGLFVEDRDGNMPDDITITLTASASVVDD